MSENSSKHLLMMVLRWPQARIAAKNPEISISCFLEKVFKVFLYTNNIYSTAPILIVNDRLYSNIDKVPA